VKNRGFTLIELIIAIAIFGILMAVSGRVYRTLVQGMNRQKDVVESDSGKILGLELLRLDLEHVGYGISNNETSRPVVWDGSDLQLRSTINNSNSGTIGWMMLQCSLGVSPTVLVDRRLDNTVNNVLLTKERDFITNQSIAASTTVQCTTCQDLNTYLQPANDYIAMAYPYDSTVTNGCSGGQYCNVITYTLSTSNPLAKCASGAQNLLRKVGNGTGERVLECVADFEVRFDWDLTGDGDVLDSGEQSLSAIPTGASTSDILTRLKNIDFYVLMQSGKKQQGFTFSGDLTANGELSSPNTAGGFTTSTVTDFSAYRWKVLKISAKPMSW